MPRVIRRGWRGSCGLNDTAQRQPDALPSGGLFVLFQESCDRGTEGGQVAQVIANRRCEQVEIYVDVIVNQHVPQRGCPAEP